MLGDSGEGGGPLQSHPSRESGKREGREEGGGGEGRDGGMEGGGGGRGEMEGRGEEGGGGEGEEWVREGGREGGKKRTLHCYK